METPEAVVNPLFPNYASENLKMGNSYRVLSKIYKIGDVGDVFTVLDISLPENPVCVGNVHHYVIMRYVTSAIGGIQEMVMEKWGSLDHTLMYSLAEILE